MHTRKPVSVLLDELWRINTSAADRCEQGVREPPAFEVQASGFLTMHTVDAGRITGEAPALTAGRRYVVEASDDLKNWREMDRVVAETGQFSLVPDEETASPDQLFLRLRYESVSSVK